MTSQRNRHPRDGGSVTLETVTVGVPLLLLLAMFTVFCGRTASAAIDVNAAAAAAARAASDAPSPAAAAVAATDAVAATTAGTRWHCTATPDVNAHRRGGHVSVAVTCTVPLSDLGVALGGARSVTGTATEPIETYRADP